MKFRLKGKKEEDSERLQATKDRMLEAMSLLRVHSERLNRIANKLSEKGRELFELCVRAEQEHDSKKAMVYANELAHVRKISRTILASHVAIEKILLRLETVRELKDLVRALAPASNTIRQVQSSLAGVMPEVAEGLGIVDDVLEGILSETSGLVESPTPVGSEDEEVKKILQEALDVAVQRVKTHFPDVPKEYEELEQTTDENRDNREY